MLMEIGFSMARILIIEDDSAMRELMEETLKATGHEVFLAANGKQGLKLHHAEPVELVITDIYMPEMEGLEFITRLRQRSNVPIIAVSGNSNVEALEKAMKLGAMRTLAKPFQPAQLRAAVSMVLNKRR